MSIPIIRGRAFTAEESFALAPSDDSPAVISETLARRLFGTVEAVGRTVRVPKTLMLPDRSLRIVGVSHDSHWNDITGQPDPLLYMPLGRYDFRALRAEIIVRSTQPATKVADAVRTAAARVDAKVPLSGGQPLIAAIDRSLREQRLFAWTLASLGALGFLLAAVGLYGLVGQTVTERAREFGIRVAMGATPADIIYLVVRYAAMVACVGTFLGVVIVLLGTRIIKTMLFGVSSLDPWVYGTAVCTLMITVALASVAPALRALRVQPVDILRTD